MIGTFGISDGKNNSFAVAVIQSIFYAKTVVDYYLSNPFKENKDKRKSQSVYLFSKVIKQIE